MARGSGDEVGGIWRREGAVAKRKPAARGSGGQEACFFVSGVEGKALWVDSF